MNELPEYPRDVSAIYQSRRDALCDGLEPGRLVVPEAEGDDVRVGPDPRAVRVARARSRSPRSSRARRAWRCRPGVGFGADGDAFVRFALVENEQRIGQAVRGIRKLLEA